MKRALCILVAALLTGILIRTYVLYPIRIVGTSMENTLLSGDTVLAEAIDRRVSFGDIVECTFGERSGIYVKRIIGLPGDMIVFSDGSLTRNNRSISEPYVYGMTEDFSVMLGEDEYLALGDHRNESHDSRSEDMGFIHASDIKGKILFRIWPLNRLGLID